MNLEIINIQNKQHNACRLCGGNTLFKFNKEILRKFNISYYECTTCLSMQTEEPYWLKESYSHDSEKFDTGKATRTLLNFINVSNIFDQLDLSRQFNYLDWGGGTGLLARLMRDIGYNYNSKDKYAKNEFTQAFELATNNENIDVISLFEVAEHFANPKNDWQEIFDENPTLIILSTQLYNNNDSNWHYISPENGQHIFFYSLRSLTLLADKYSYSAYRLGDYLLFTKHAIDNEKLKLIESFYAKDNNSKLKVISDWYDNPYKFCAKDHAEITKLTNNSDEKIIVDGVFFQINNSGISRVWDSLLKIWSSTPLAKRLLILNRGGTAPIIEGIEYLHIQNFDYQRMEEDELLLQTLCDKYNASLFISTYYTKPKTTPTLLMVYDMIPEVLNWDMSHPMWIGKIKAIEHASHYVCISRNTLNDLENLYTNSKYNSTIAYCGLSNDFNKSSSDEIITFKNKYGITKNYFLTVGERGAHKNIRFFLESLIKLENYFEYEIVFLGGQSQIEPDLQEFTKILSIKRIRIDDDEMATAYSGAISLVYPSLYEGFGMPIIEALACECPVITSNVGSIPEIALDSVIYVDPYDTNSMRDALIQVQDNSIRKELASKGMRNIQRFSWKKMANIVSESIINTEKMLELRKNELKADSYVLEELIKCTNRINNEKYSIDAIYQLHKYRHICASRIIETDKSFLNIRFSESLGSIHSLLIKFGCYDLSKTISDLQIEDYKDNLKLGDTYDQLKIALVEMMYARPHLQSSKWKVGEFQSSYLDCFLQYVLTPPSNFNTTGEANLYNTYLTDIAQQIYEQLHSEKSDSRVMSLAINFINRSSTIPLYFAESNLLDFMSLRAKIIEYLIARLNNSPGLDFTFSTNPIENSPIRVGIMAAHFRPQTETYATLPVYQHLNQDKYEVILISQSQIGDHPLEVLCKQSSMSQVVLSGELNTDVNKIRSLGLDFLWIGTNITAVLNYMVQLSVHRLARVQATGGCSPVTTGFKNIDIFCSGSLTEPLEAQNDYTEKLYLLDGPAHCFDMSTSFEQNSNFEMFNRKEIGVPDNATIFVSGANFFKLIPELIETWAEILRRVKDSYLILFPFNPNWTSNYPAANLLILIGNTLDKFKIERNRVILIKPLSSRAEILNLIKESDIYLDSFPYSGMTSLLDPLEVKIPIVALEGNHQRERMSSSALKSLELDNWITYNKNQYIETAVKIAASKELQNQMKGLLSISMKKNPKFLDSKWFSGEISELINNSLGKKYGKN